MATASTVFRDFVTDGVPASGVWKPRKIDIRELLAEIEQAIANIAIGGSSTYKGTWNANSNSPAIVPAAPENTGSYYFVRVAGTTEIDGVTSWGVGDIIVSNGAAWQRVPLSSALLAVLETEIDTRLTAAETEIDTRLGVVESDIADAITTLTRYIDKGDTIPAALDLYGARAVINDGYDEALVVARNSWWVPTNGFKPTWLPDKMTEMVHFARRRLYRQGRGLGYRDPTDFITVTRASGRWARDADDTLHYFEPNTLALTTLGIAAHTSVTNVLRYSRDLRITHRIARGAITGGPFEDGETVTASGGGTGTYVLDQEVGTNFPVAGGTGTFSGTLTGQTSGATCNINSVVAIWERTGAMTVTHNVIGADGDAARGTRFTAGTTNARIMQATTTAAAAYVGSLRIRRAVGTGIVEITLDGGATWIDVTSQLVQGEYKWVRVPTQLLVASPAFGIRIRTSGDAIDLDFAQLESGYFCNDPVVTTAAAATKSADIMTPPISTFGTTFTSSRLTAFAGVLPENIFGSAMTFMEISDGTNDERIAFNAVAKDDYPTDNIQIGVTIVTGGSAQGYDPLTEKLQIGDMNCVGFTLDQPNGTLIVALNGDTRNPSPLDPAIIPDPGNFTTWSVGSRAGGALLNGYLQWMAFGRTTLTEQQMADLTDLSGELFEDASI